MKRILNVADRPGWAIDRLAKPMAQMYDNVDVVYFNASRDRFVDTGFTDSEEVEPYDYKKCNGYDIVHFHSAKAALCNVGKEEFRHIDKISKKVRKILHVHTERLSDFNGLDLDVFDDFICPTKYVYYRFLNKYGGEKKKRVHLVPQGVDLKKFQYQFKDPNEKAIGFVGNIVEHKGFDILAQAVGIAGFNMIGCGFITNGNIYARGLRACDNLKFVSFLPEQQMGDFYARMDMFVCLSRPYIETGPLPVLEAMACGVPVVSSEVGWAKDWCEHGRNIWFLEKDKIVDPYKLSRTLQNLYLREDIKNSLRVNGLHLVKEFSIEKYAKRLMKIYND